ncbi:MAG: tryptophan synthase subunit alpha, partial [Lentisphaeria bacterium]|nr:tryptophan synthase subunit alpha [Lentisphaeria bacterium]
MNRFENIFSGNKKALIVFDCAGAPDMASSAERIEKIITAGADIVELGIPFSDPMADGAAIQEAYQTALQNNSDLSKIIAMLKTVRQNHPATGLIISGYCNIFLQYGYEKLFADLSMLEIDALRILDLPAEEFTEIAPYAEKYGVKTVISVS